MGRQQSKSSSSLRPQRLFLKAQLIKVVLSFDQSISEEIKGNYDKAEEALKKAQAIIEEVKYNSYIK